MSYVVNQAFCITTTNTDYLKILKNNGGAMRDRSGRPSGADLRGLLNLVNLFTTNTKLMVELCGIEPQTSWMQTKRSPS